MKHISRRLTVLLLIFTMIVAAVAANITVHAVDLDRSCTIVVHQSESFSDLAEANMVVDVYKVAYAEMAVGYDSYTLVPTGVYEGLYLNGEEAYDEEVGAYIDWSAVAQQATYVALTADTPVRSGVPVEESIPDLESGLYLLLVRGADLEDYRDIVIDEDENWRIVTVGKTSTYNYFFSPVLVSLPSREATAGGTVHVTTDFSSWHYSVEITTKPERDLSHSSIEIICNLEGYSEGDPAATCVYQIEAVRNGVKEYSNVVSLTFNGTGQESHITDRIPVGSEVTVTQVYAGPCYKLVTDPVQTCVVTPEEIVAVEFTTTRADTALTGSSITNEFMYTEDGWEWTPIKNR